MSTSTVPSESSSYQVELASYARIPYRQTLYGDVLRALATGEQRVIVNCSGWQQLNLSILSALIRCAKACREQRADFELVNLDDRLRADIRELRLDGQIGLSH